MSSHPSTCSCRAAAARQEEPRREQQEPQERWRDQWGDDKKPWEKGPDDSALGKQASIDQLFPPEPKVYAAAKRASACASL